MGFGGDRCGVARRRAGAEMEQQDACSSARNGPIKSRSTETDR